MKQTAVEWLVESLSIHFTFEQQMQFEGLFQQAKEMEEQDIDNKVIHFAEWLTKKHTLELMVLYEQFKKK